MISKGIVILDLLLWFLFFQETVHSTFTQLRYTMSHICIASCLMESQSVRCLTLEAPLVVLLAALPLSAVCGAQIHEYESALRAGPHLVPLRETRTLHSKALPETLEIIMWNFVRLRKMPKRHSWFQKLESTWKAYFEKRTLKFLKWLSQKLEKRTLK